ncbi:cyclic di-AMP binding protein CbpA [Alkalihalobacterium sp. APHAB7]|uniref:cyclic di-AMP binding protein CbpA n=1 Tax=Alkalihalobacterium sp. APHAB7 TaxID=3402081 RepID=UPI003AAE838F
MRVSNIYKDISNIVFSKESDTLQEALTKLEESGYRCIPILDENSEKFLGNIYKSKIYEYIVKEQGDLSLPVTTLARDKAATIHKNSSFFEAFLSIKRLPYLTILNEKEHFVGILTHSHIMNILEDSWGVDQGSYTLSIIAMEYKGALNKVTQVINKYTHIQSLITLDNRKTYSRRIVVTLPKEVDEALCQKIISSLNKNGFRVFDTEEPFEHFDQ